MFAPYPLATCGLGVGTQEQPFGLAQQDEPPKRLYPRLLRRVSRQRVSRHLGQFRDLEWLVFGLSEKYGIRPDGCTALSDSDDISP